MQEPEVREQGKKVVKVSIRAKLAEKALLIDDIRKEMKEIERRVNECSYKVMKLFLLGAISRIFKPGTKFGYMLCLVGVQGAVKSTFSYGPIDYLIEYF